MKRLLLFILLLGLGYNGYSQWTVVDTLSNNVDCTGGHHTPAVYWVSPDVNYWSYIDITCYYGDYIFSDDIYGTKDSFKTSFYFLTASYPDDIDFVSPDTIYISYSCDFCTSIFERFTNNGNTETSLSNKNLPRYLSYVNGHLGYGFREDSLFRFYNDSIYFVSKVNNFPVYDNSTFFSDSLHGFIFISSFGKTVGDNDTIIRTEDGGLNWAIVELEKNRNYQPYIEKINDSVMYIFADSGYVYKSTDIGATWHQCLHDASITTMHFLTEQHAYGLISEHGHNYYCQSDDGGIHWVLTSLPDGIYPNDIRMFNNDVGYILADDSDEDILVLKTTNNGGTSSPFSTISPMIFFQNPVKELLSIYTLPPLDNIEAVISIIDMLGRTVAQQHIVLGNDFNIDVSRLAKGIYFLEIRTDSDNIVKRFVKE